MPERNRRQSIVIRLSLSAFDTIMARHEQNRLTLDLDLFNAFDSRVILASSAKQRPREWGCRFGSSEARGRVLCAR